uniref:Acyl-CoA dehydrogenase n=1 Tax=Candidatus Kentrum sp. UNK TaxID=2126344 RepID=A0A451AZ69_9GAMM|nr:MAG: Acyl-CoA dehydrogenase [Candidatus Kentron sp. UNK]VFK71217.1 MAG: Acyl-CoA dehydrogenase [Candidatus Kentron sp. UNK]
MTEEQTKRSAITANKLIDWLRTYASRRINSRLMDERRCIPPHVMLELGNQGILGMNVPKEYGGLGLTDVDIMRVTQQLGAIDISLATFVSCHMLLGVYSIIHHARPELRARLLPHIATGRTLAAFALTEPEAGSNPRGLIATGVSDKTGNWRLNGDKCWIGNGSSAGVVSVFVRLLDVQGRSRGITGFVLEADNPGLHPGLEALTMGMRGMVQSGLHLRDAPVTEEALLGEPGAGFVVAQDAMMTGRLGIGAMCVGATRRCAQLFHRYAERRIIATSRLLDNPVTLERLAFMDRSAVAVESLVYRLAELRDRGEYVPDFGYVVCKIAGSEFLCQSLDWVMQGLGGRGYMENNVIPQMLRDARVFRIFEGPTETLQMYLGQRLLYRSRGLITQFIARQLKSPRMAERTCAAIDAITDARKGRVESSPDQKQRLAFRCGELATWCVLTAALDGLPSDQRKRGHSDAQSWTEQQFDMQLRRIVKGETLFVPTASELVGRISAYVDSVGDLEQDLPCEDWALDPMLRVDPTKIETAPIQPQTVSNPETATSK